MNYIGIKPDYIAIGKRIRKYRWDKNISQEQLAEKIGVSATHMSHIETGSTKLSLTVLLKISEALKISTDLLIKGNLTKTQDDFFEPDAQIQNERQAKIIFEISKAIKEILEKEGV